VALVPCKKEERANAAFASWRDMDSVLVIFGLRVEDGASPIRKLDQRDKVPLTLFSAKLRPEKNQELN
jgi:hypothetical protein